MNQPRPPFSCILLIHLLGARQEKETGKCISPKIEIRIWGNPLVKVFYSNSELTNFAPDNLVQRKMPTHKGTWVPGSPRKGPGGRYFRCRWLSLPNNTAPSHLSVSKCHPRLKLWFIYSIEDSLQKMVLLLPPTLYFLMLTIYSTRFSLSSQTEF